MAIDPMLYKKYSGRSGDPYERLGAALAQSSAQKSALKAAKDVPFSSRMYAARRKVKMITLVVGGIIVIVGALYSMT